jgi:hypothetical protein
MTFLEIMSRFAWRPIPHCPGRYLLIAGPSALSPQEIVSPAERVTVHVVAAAKDPVVVAAFDDGGLISYRRPDGTYVHTLNSRDGFDRKLRQLGVAVRR